MCVGECKYAGSVSEERLALSGFLVFFVGVLKSERPAALVGDEERCSLLRPRPGGDEERLKNAKSLRMTNEMMKRGRRMKDELR